MATRIPLSTLSSATQTVLLLHGDLKDEDSRSADATSSDENTAPLAHVSEDIEGVVEVGTLTLAPSVDTDAVRLEITEDLSYLVLSAPEDVDESSDDEAAVDAAGSDDDSDETMRRFLAFANRGRASGSGLPAVLAHLSRAVDDADDSDSETAELFVSCVAGVIRQERHIQTAVAEILEDDQLVVESPTDEEGLPLCGRCAESRGPEEQRVFEAWLVRRAAFEELGVTRLDGADTDGFTLAQLDKQGRTPAKPLRRKLLKYFAEVDVYDECTYHGIRYPKPYALYVKPDIKQSSRAYVVESGTIGDKTPQIHI